MLHHAELTDAANTLLRETLQRGAAINVFAPGRVNLIGEHTDYNDGFVLPCALPVGTAVAMAPREDHRIRAVSLMGGVRLQDEFDADQHIERMPIGFWGNYLRGVIAAMQQAGIHPMGADLAFVGNVPPGAGLSSSASLAVAAARALAAPVTQLEASPAAIARWAQSSEHHYAGCQCGIMDQMAAAIALPGEALFLDCRSLESQRISLPPGITVLVAHSGAERTLATGEYNLRRLQCESAAQHLGVRSLRDASADDLQAHQARLSSEEFRRARHVVGENARVLELIEAFKTRDLQSVAGVLRRSHASLRDDFEVTIPVVDQLVDFLNDTIDEAGGLGGARMTGGGFGGCVVAIVSTAIASDLRRSLTTYLERSTQRPPLVLELAGNVMN